MFNILAPYIEGAVFLDLFAGCGCMGMEAISRGASSAVFVESDPECVGLIKKNAGQLRITDKCFIIRADVPGFLRKPRLEKKFNIVYIDPPYRSELFNEAIEILGGGELLDRAAIVIGEHSAPPKIERAGFLGLRESRRYTGRTCVSIWDYAEERPD